MYSPVAPEIPFTYGYIYNVHGTDGGGNGGESVSSRVELEPPEMAMLMGID